MPRTALSHFAEDIARTLSLVDLTDGLAQTTTSDQTRRSDVLRSGWMFSVGALDAYFSDAYADIVGAALISKSRHQAMQLPEFFYKIRVPVAAVLEPYNMNFNWRWRMLARRLMDDESILKLGKIESLFNRFFRQGQSFFGDVMDRWMQHPDANRRLFGCTPTNYRSMNPPARHAARNVARAQLRSRFADIFQRRHDCIHNCDRPRISPQPLDESDTVRKVVHDIGFLVRRCDEHITSEMREFLAGCGCPRTVAAQVGY